MLLLDLLSSALSAQALNHYLVVYFCFSPPVIKSNRYAASQFWFNGTAWSSRSVGALAITLVRLLTPFPRALAVECVATTFIIVM